MQTNFTLAQLAEPDIARADGILRKCVHCGFCLATCPTYAITGDERDSPRGRIWLIRDMLENDDNDGAVVGHHLDRCLTCLSCTTTCPSGVDYARLVDIGRKQSGLRHTRGFFDRVSRKILLTTLPIAGRAYGVMMAAWMLRPLRFLMPKPIDAMLAAAPSSRPRFDAVGGKDTVYKADVQPPKKRVVLLAGCVQRAINPDINAATISILNRIGVDVVIRQSAVCCGGIAQHTGDEGLAKTAMTATIKAWGIKAGGNQDALIDIDAIVINASGCGTVVKDYVHYFTDDPILAEVAAKVSAMTMDITEFLHQFGLGEVDLTRTKGLSVAYHSACSLQHGQKITSIPKALLTEAGFEVRDIAEPHLCCGSAGTYNLLQPVLAGGLKNRKLKAINAVKADFVAAGNLGCINQLAASNAPILHTVQLLDWATGGTPPP